MCASHVTFASCTTRKPSCKINFLSNLHQLNTKLITMKSTRYKKINLCNYNIFCHGISQHKCYVKNYILTNNARDTNYIYKWDTITYFRNSRLKICVNCNPNTRYNLNSYMCVIVIVYKYTCAYAQGYILVFGIITYDLNHLKTKRKFS